MGAMTSRDQLQIAISNLYQVFSSYSSQQPVYGCPHCISKEDANLLAGALQSIETHVLADYAGSAITTWGDVDDFKRFLPRLFELGSFDKSFGADQEILLSKLSYGKWKEWSDVEQDAVECYLKALIRYTLLEQTFLRTTEIIDGASRSGFDVVSALTSIVREDPSLQSTIALCDLIESLYQRLLNHDRGGQHTYSKIRKWLLSQEITERLENVFFEEMERPATAAKISHAVDLISFIR